MVPAGRVSELVGVIEQYVRNGFWIANGDDFDHAVGLWKELALHECLQFFKYQGEQHRLEAPSGDKTILMFRNVLEDYSVAQAYNFIWGSARDAAAFYQRGQASRKQAANAMVGNCRTRAEKARVEKWSVKCYGRNYDLPQSELGRVLFDFMYKIGEDGFNKKPNAENLQGNAKTSVAV